MIEIGTNVAEFHDTSGSIEDATQEHMEEAARVGFQESQRLVPKDTGGLMMSGVPPHRRQDGSIVWAYDAPHALPVEYGSVPHYPPIKPLLKWARRVLGDESAAYAVQQKIGEEGTQPQPYVRPAFREQKRHISMGGLISTIRGRIPGL